MALEATIDNPGAVIGYPSDRLTSKWTRRSDQPPEAAPTYPALPTTRGRQSPFLLREQTGSGETTMDRQGNEVQTKERTRSFPPELVTDFRKSLRGQMDRLMDIQRSNPEAFERFMADEHFRPFREVFEKFTSLKEGSETSGGRGIRILNEADFNNYFGTDAGFLRAFDLRKLKLQEMAIEGGIFLDDNLPVPGPQTIRDQDINTGPGGKGRELARRAGHWLTERRTRYGREIPINYPTGEPLQGELHLHSKGDIAATIATLSTVFGGVGATAGPIGALIGVAAPPAIAKVIDSFHRGERVTMEQVNTALQIAQAADPVRREWAREVYNVDSTNYEIDAQGQVVIRADIANNTQIANPSTYAEELRDRIARENSMIMRAQEAMGIRRELRGGMDVMGLIPGREEQFRQRGLVTEIDAQREWLQSPQLVDNNGNTARIQNADGEWVPNPAFDWQNTDRNAAYVLRDEIYRRRLSEGLANDFEEIAEWGKDHKEDFEAEITRAKERNNILPEQRKAELDDQEGYLTSDQDRLRAEIPAFTDIQTVLTGVDTARRTADQARRNVIEVTPHPTGATDAVTLLNYVLNHDPAGGTVFALDVMHQGTRLRIESVAGREALALKGYQDAVDEIAESAPTGKGADQIINKRLSIAESIYNQRMSAINRDKTAVTEALNAITNANEQMRTAYEAFSVHDAQREAIADTATQMQTARGEIESWSMPGVDLSTAELQGQSFDELMARINAINGISGEGWPEADNNLPENRERLIHAIAEARAIAIEPRIEAPSADFVDMTGPMYYNFSETDLVVMSAEQLRERMNDMIARAPVGSALNGIVLPPDAIDLINEIKNEAQARFSARLRGMQAFDREITSRITIIENQKTRIDRDGVRTPEFDAIERARPRTEDIRTLIRDRIPQAQFIDMLSTAQASTQPGQYSEAERAVGNSIAYVNIMEWIFNHRDDTEASEGTATARDAAFARNSNFLDQDTLRDLIYDWNRYPLTPAGNRPRRPATFERAVDRVRNAIQNGEITKHQFAQFLTENVIYGYMRPLVNGL